MIVARRLVCTVLHGGDGGRRQSNPTRTQSQIVMVKWRLDGVAPDTRDFILTRKGNKR